jgi:hypothetical protein
VFLFLIGGLFVERGVMLTNRTPCRSCEPGW